MTAEYATTTTGVPPASDNNRRMSDHHTSPADGRSSASRPDHSLLRSALDQIEEDSRLYNEAVGSYNTHLNNHRDRRDLHDLPYRDPIAAHGAFDDALNGDRAAIEAVLTHLLNQPHLDSQLRRHPRTYPIHIEATEHLEIARERLIATLEEALQHKHNTGDGPRERHASATVNFLPDE